MYKLILSLIEAGPKEWLREQKKKTSKYVLAPIEASHQTLEKAYQLLSNDLLLVFDNAFC
jgi:hypothetical protein